MRNRILIGLLAGTLGGFLGWFLQERLINHAAHVVIPIRPGDPVTLNPLTPQEMRLFVLAVGGFIGLFLGAVDGFVESNTRKLARGMALGAVTGVLLGYIGMFVGSVVFNTLGGRQSEVGIGQFAQQVLARSFGWAVMGLGLGVGSQLGTMSPKRIRNGAIGGFLGGFAGGFVFDLLAVTTNPVQQIAGGAGPREVGAPSRMVGLMAIGGLIGLLTGLVEAWLKQAWVRVLVGRNEGRDFTLYRPVNILGRDERADVPLFGDTSVAPQHAAIRAERYRHVLIDAGTQPGTLVNGQRVQPGGEVVLSDGDMIQVGLHSVLFREKATARKAVEPPRDVAKPRPAPVSAMAASVCTFCGAPKDAAGNCRCSVGAPAAGTPIPAPMPLINSTPPPAYGGGFGLQGSAPGPYPAPGGEAVMPRLVGVEGPYSGQVFLLTEQNVTVGREPERSIALTADSTISRSHARVSVEGGEFVVYDTGSSNGTFVNGQRISMQVLKSGDNVQFGASKFRFE